MKYTAAVVATLLALMPWAEARGQSADQVPAASPARSRGLQPALFVDSLTSVADPIAVRRLGRASEPDPDESVDLHLRYALIEKRLFELTDDDDARKAAQRSFDHVKKQDATSTWAHFGYGWALAHGPEFKSRFISIVPGAATVSALGGIIGLDAAGRAKRSLQRALELDAAFEPAVLELARLALITKQPKDVASAASAARRAIGAGRVTAGIYTQLAELEMLRGNGAAAAEAARAAMKVQPTGPAQRALGVALLAMPGEAEAGAVAYMDGLSGTAFADTALSGAYMTDIAALLTADERETVSRFKPNEKAQWLQDFWERSAARSGRTVPQRLTEHFARLQYALATYQRHSKFGVRGGTAFMLAGEDSNLPFDDRGLLYVKLGKPEVTISTPPGQLTPPPNESWVYSRDGAVEMYHFHKFSGASEWVLSPLEPCDPVFLTMGQQNTDRNKDDRLVQAIQQLSVAHSSSGTARQYVSYLEERAKYDKRLNGYLVRCMGALQDVSSLVSRVERSPDANEAALTRLLGPGPWLAQNYTGSIGDLRTDAMVFAKEDQRRAIDALRTDDARPKYATPLQAITQLYAFRGEDGSTALTAAVLIPGQRFTPAQRNGVMVYPLSLSLIVMDSATGRVQRADATPAFRANQTIGTGKWFRATLDLQAAPMEQADYSVVIENAGNPAEGDIRSGSQNIPSFASSALMVSDLVVGEAGEGRWKRGTQDINPIPSHQIERGKSFKLYYEVYNLPAGAKYRTTIHVAPKESGGIAGALKSLIGKKQAVEFDFDDVAGTPTDPYGLQQLRSIGADLEAGRYDLTVTVTNVDTAATATRKTKLIVLSEKDLKAR